MPRKKRHPHARSPGLYARSREPADAAVRGGPAAILFDSMFQFVGLLDPDGILIAANRASIEAVGTRERDVLGRPFWDTPWWRGLPDAQSRLRGAVRRAAEGEFVRYEVEHRGHGGTGLLTADFSLNPVRDGAGRVVYLVAEGRDITDRVRAEAEVADKARDLEVLNARLARAHAEKTTLFANVSHELRTPLALVIGTLDRVLAGEEDGASVRVALETARRNARILLAQVNDLLEISRVDAGRLELHRASADLSELVRSTASLFDGVARERAMRFEVVTPGPLPLAMDARKIERVLVNLLANAFKFTPPGGVVRCAVHADVGRAVLTVADSGPGVPASQRQRIFERFVQGDGGVARRHAGTGLGLAIAREFVALHGGSIRAEDARDGGAQFTVELPVDAHDARDETPGSTSRTGALDVADDPRLVVESLHAPPEPRERERHGSGAQSLVLVVEDNPEMRCFVADALASRFRVATAADGDAALASAMKLRPDLILTDVMMPGLSGDDLVRRVRAIDALKDVPIVALTARADDALRIRMIEEGALDYLTKPFSARELVARVSNLVALRRLQYALQEHLQSRTRDVHQLMAEMVLRNRELEAAVETARIERDRAEGASRAKSDFLGLVSHELLTPISTARLTCELLKREGRTLLSERQSALVERVLAALERLAIAVRSLLQYVRIESGRMDLRRKAVDIRALAAEVLDGVRPVAERKGLELRLVADPAARAETDDRLLQLVLANLVSNAVKFTASGVIRIVLSRAGDRCRIAVEDSGPGIAAEERARIFEPFHPGESLAHKHVPGIGLGLALARQMTEVLGGTLALEPHDGPGSTFVVTLAAAGAVDPATSLA